VVHIAAAQSQSCFANSIRIPRPEQVLDAVLFVVWDWLESDITIIPDGFGTHAGTGGWGLAVVLEHYDRLPADLQAELPLKRIWALVQEPED
jgi:hypothetical protein